MATEINNPSEKHRYNQIRLPLDELSVFGDHNLQNMEAAWLVCNELGIGFEDFRTSIKDFTGAGKRLQKLHSSDGFDSYLDFAHAPSENERNAGIRKAVCS